MGDKRGGRGKLVLPIGDTGKFAPVTFDVAIIVDYILASDLRSEVLVVTVLNFVRNRSWLLGRRSL